MICRPIEEKDHETAVKWWTGHDFPAIPLEALPPTGCIIDDVCLGYLYLSNGGIAWAEWVVRNPEVKGFDARNGIVLLLKEMLVMAKDNGNHRIFSSVKNESLLKIMSGMGFQICDSEMTNLIYF